MITGNSGQIGSELEKILTEDMKDNFIIHLSWDVWNKNDKKSQEGCIKETEKLLADNPEKTFVFISTKSDAENPYVKAKRKAEEIVKKSSNKYQIIRLPNVIGKGVTERFLFSEPRIFGTIELLTPAVAAEKIKALMEKGKSGTFDLNGDKLGANTYKSMLSFVKKKIENEIIESQFDVKNKMLSHLGRVNELMNEGRTRPVLVELLPTNFCNANCPWCFYRETQGKEKIKKETMINALKSMRECGVKAINWSGGGEPTIHPDFKEFVRVAHRLGFKQGLFTNAIDPIRVEPDMFNWIRVSETDRGFFPELKEIIPRWAESTKVGYNINITPDYPEKILRKTVREVYKANADYVQIRPALTRLARDQQRIKYPYYLRGYERPGFKVYLSLHKFKDYLDSPKYKKCLGCWFCPTVDYNGKLMTCEYWLGNPNFEIGDLNKRPFKEIWNSEKTKEKLNSITDLSGCQHCCRNHEVNKFLFSLKYGKPGVDADFL